MDRETTRRALLGAVFGGGLVAGFGPGRSYLDRFAPVSGSVWRSRETRPRSTVESPHGDATLRYDEEGVAHVSADDEPALYYAVGYAQGTDRLFQMDLYRRRMAGELSAVFGERTLQSDRFHTALDFEAAARATASHVEGTPTGDAIAAFSSGVNRAIESEPLPVEFQLLGYEPEPWSPVDAALIEKQIAWSLTGSFRTLRKARIADAFDAATAEQLFPRRMDHDAPIIRDEEGDGDGASPDARPGQSPPEGLLNRLSPFESPPGFGSNSWVVSGEHTASGDPIVANDPHLLLTVPPIWYEMHLRTDAFDVRGVGFPGAPFVVIGENETDDGGGAWGFTNSNVDVIDFYTYETADGGYVYDGDTEPFEEESRTIAVADGEDREVTVRKTVHGPVIATDENGDPLAEPVGIAWTGFAATETARGTRLLARSDGLDDAREAIAHFDCPPQNFVYADRDGNTLFAVTGRIPIRRTDGERVTGDRIFDGSAPEGEWAGYEPFTQTRLDPVVDPDKKPELANPGYVGTANQRIVDEPETYLSEGYGPPFRGIRLNERLDRRIEGGEPVTPAFVENLQADVLDVRARRFVPVVLEAGRGTSDRVDDLLDTLEGWDYRMTVDSEPALVFSTFLEHYREVVFREDLERALPAAVDVTAFYPNDWVLVTLPADARWFGEDGPRGAIRTALERAAATLAGEDWDTYGDRNALAIEHPFDRSWLNYDPLAVGGSRATLRAIWTDLPAASSWRMVSRVGPATSRAILPGGNDGRYFSAHYADQLDRWADLDYKPMGLSMDGEVVTRFEGVEDG